MNNLTRGDVRDMMIKAIQVADISLSGKKMNQLTDAVADILQLEQTWPMWGIDVEDVRELRESRGLTK